ncbi:MAG: ATP-binding protein [Planctomycetes bacterium]|nr:ATP-binding protein [Planctomycetota bacterium]
MKTVSTADIARSIASSTGREEAGTQTLLESALQQIAQSVSQGKGIALPSFGFLGAGGGEAMDLSAFGAALSAATGRPSDECEALVPALGAALREAALGGQRISLSALGTVEVRREKARIVRDSSRGHKIIAPASQSIGFTPDPATASTGREVALQLEPELQQAVSGSRPLSVLLAVPDRDAYVRTLEYYFQRAGWKTNVSTSVVDAMQQIEGEGTYLIVLDHVMKEAQKLCQGVKCRRELSNVPLIVTYPSGTNLGAPTELMICGDEQVVQPYEVKKLLSLADSELVRVSEEEIIFDHQVTFQFPTEEGNIDRANELAHRLFEMSGLDEDSQVAMCAAFREAVGNAAQHGNRYRRDKKIEVLYLLDHEKVTVQVKDSGPGFEHTRYVSRGQAGDAITAARERHREGRLGGLGIMLMLRCADHLEYNDSGNSITLTKNLKRRPGSNGDGGFEPVP